MVPRKTIFVDGHKVIIDHTVTIAQLRVFADQYSSFTRTQDYIGCYWHENKARTLPDDEPVFEYVENGGHVSFIPEFDVPNHQ